MKYSEALELRKEGSLEKRALFPKRMMDLIDKVLHYDLLKPIKNLSPVKKYRTGAEALAEGQRLMAEAKKLEGAAKVMPKWRRRAIGAGILGTAGTVGGFMAGQATAGNPYAQTQPQSYAEWAAANKK